MDRNQGKMELKLLFRRNCLFGQDAVLQQANTDLFSSCHFSEIYSSRILLTELRSHSHFYIVLGQRERKYLETLTLAANAGYVSLSSKQDHM